MLEYSVVQRNWLSDVTGCMLLRCMAVTSENQFHCASFMLHCPWKLADEEKSSSQIAKATTRRSRRGMRSLQRLCSECEQLASASLVFDREPLDQLQMHVLVWFTARKFLSKWSERDQNTFELYQKFSNVVSRDLHNTHTSPPNSLRAKKKKNNQCNSITIYRLKGEIKPHTQSMYLPFGVWITCICITPHPPPPPPPDESITSE